MSLAPWGDLLAAAAHIGLPPDAFWRTSVKEWRLLAGGVARACPMERAQLEQLSKTFPDEGESDGGNQ